MAGMVGRTATGKHIAVAVDEQGIVQVAQAAPAAAVSGTPAQGQLVLDQLDAIKADLDAIKTHLGI